MESAKEDDEDESAPSDDEEVEDDLVMEDELMDFFSLSVEDKDGKEVLLRDIVGKTTPTLLVMLRHFGCMLCRQLCGHLLKRKMEFYNLYGLCLSNILTLSRGIPIVAISTGTPAAAKSFSKEVKFPGNIYLDQKRTLYKALSCKRGVKYSMSMKTLAIARKAYEEGFRQGPTNGDLL